MALIFRLGSRSVLNHIVLNNNRLASHSLIRPITMKIQKAQPESQLGHDEHNMQLKRPLSPHLLIYKPQVTSMLSISHRFTGIALTVYVAALGIGALALPNGIPHYIDALAAANVGAAPVFAGKFLLAFPFSYHFWNGIRHLIWDTGRFLTNKGVYVTGYSMLAVSIGSTIALCSM